MARGKKKETLTPEERLQAALVPESEQPYKVPENWCWVRIDAISSVYTGNSISKQTKEKKYMGISDGLVYIATKDISFDLIINYDTGVRIPDWKNFKVAPKYSTLLCIEGGSAGRKIGFLTQDVCFVNKLCAFVPNSYINPKYLFYVLQSPAFKQQFEDNMHGLIGGVSVTELSSFSMPFPPIKRQNQIVDQLESLFAKLDEAKQKAQDALDSVENRKAAILHKAFTGELTSQWRKENSVGIESWTHNRLGKYLQPLESKKPQGKEFRYIDIDSIDNVKQAVREPKKILVKNAPSRANRGLKTNDILFSMVRPYLKNIAYIDESLSDCIASTGFYVCRCKQDLLPRYLYHFLCSKDAIDYLMQFMKGDNSPSIRKIALLEMPVQIPLISEQTEIVRILDDLLAKEQQAKEAAEAVLEQIDLIKKAILARAFRGKLGTNDPAEESAVELVKKVLKKNSSCAACLPARHPTKSKINQK